MCGTHLTTSQDIGELFKVFARASGKSKCVLLSCSVAHPLPGRTLQLQRDRAPQSCDPRPERRSSGGVVWPGIRQRPHLLYPHGATLPAPDLPSEVGRCAACTHSPLPGG